MNEEIQKLIDQYHTWLKDKTVLRQLGDWTEITTPYIDRHNDYIQVYAKSDNGNFVLTDDSYTIEDLISSGCELDKPRRKALLKTTLNGFGVQLEGRALSVRATRANFPSRKHNLLQAMLAVNDMFYLARPMVASLFYEDVTSWLDLSEIRYIPKVKLTGITGFDYVFDFAIPKSKAQPERIMQAINHPNRESATKFMMGWHDTREARPIDTRAYAFLNDMEHEPPELVIDAFKSYDIRPILWSMREQVKPELSA